METGNFHFLDLSPFGINGGYVLVGK